MLANTSAPAPSGSPRRGRDPRKLPRLPPRCKTNEEGRPWTAAARRPSFADAAGLDFQAGGAMLRIEESAGFPPSAAGSRSAPR
jgi:hypothetical protein